MAAPRHLILYGSLRQGEPAFLKLGLDRRLSFERPVRFPGTLYDLGAYPGVVLGTAGNVVGELHAVTDPSVLADLDDFELYRPRQRRPYDAETDHGSLYLRRTIRVGGTAAAIYELNVAAPPTAPVIASGDWLAYRGL